MKAAALALLLGLAPAYAFLGLQDQPGIQRRWSLLVPSQDVHTNCVNTNTRAIRFFIASDAYSATNTAAELNAIRATFAQWQAVSGTHLKFEDAGLLPAGLDADAFNDTNQVLWAKASHIINGGSDNITGRLGVTLASFFADGVLAEADIVLNAAPNAGTGGGTFRWFTDFERIIEATNNTDQFIEAVMTHEIGHLIGLEHAPFGGSSMLFRAGSGVNTQAGLSPDEVSAARALYPATNGIPTYGALRGAVTMNSAAVFGAAVFIEDAHGNIVASTLTREDGNYILPAVPPGTYSPRVAPLDPFVAESLISGPAISFDHFGTVETAFRPATNAAVTLTAGATNVLNFTVTSGAQPFRIGYLRLPTDNPGFSFTYGASPISLRPGQSNMTIGVFGSTLPASGIRLDVTGTGITLGAQTLHPGTPFVGLNGISTTIQIASNAVPGSRSLIVTRTNDNARAWANGFLEILPLSPDHNFDGVNDIFQRRHFPLFTAAVAGPDADPDNDRFNNFAESIAGTNPTNALSRLELQSVTTTAAGATLRWQSVTGKSYQIAARPDVGGGAWQNLGAPVTATNTAAAYFDAGATNAAKFYRVTVLP